MKEWFKVSENRPPENVPVYTKIDDNKGVRNENEILRLRGRLWWTSDEKMYVYYTPTHWAKL